MFYFSRILLHTNQRETSPNIAKLLYGKRKNALHITSKAKPSIVGILISISNVELRAAARRACVLKELHKENLSELFRKYRVLNRLDRAEIIVEVLDEVKIALTSSHYCTLMAHANDNKDWKTALRFWHRACSEKKVNEKLHGALLATYRSAGRWKDAIEHFNIMLEDKIKPDAYALHTVMNACRRAEASDMGFLIFSKAVNAGVSPNSTVYLELLRCIQQSSLPNKWKVSLTILNSLEGKIDVTAGLYNATIATMGGSNWEKGVQLFQTMKSKNIQPSKETLTTLLGLNPNNISHTVQCIAEAHTLGMPITDSMYRAVITNLFKLNLDHEAVRFAHKEYLKCVTHPSNPVNSSLALSLAIMDSLLSHHRPHEGFLFFNIFESKLANIITSATRGLGSIGVHSQRWIVQGRVGVVDHNVLLNPRFESLLAHYDSVLIPFSSIRILVRRVREMRGTVKGSYTKQTLKRIQELTVNKSPLRILPLSHQLNAHTYIVDGPITTESVALLHKTAEENIKEENEKVKELPGPLLIRRSNGLPSAIELTSVFYDNIKEELNNNNNNNNNSEISPSTSESSIITNKTPNSILKYSDRLTAPERVLAVAVMLKSLNPDASIHLISPSPIQLEVVEQWNKLQPNILLTPVLYPDEVSIKAPTEVEVKIEVKEEVLGNIREELKEKIEIGSISRKENSKIGRHNVKSLFIPS